MVKERFRRLVHPIRLPRWLVEWLDHKRQSSGKIVETALIEHYHIEPPPDYVPPDEDDEIP